jgi:branched-chain amino acid transport system permease protein
LLIAYPLIFTTSFSHHLMILILLYALMAQSWNVVAGLSGQISLGHAIFFGIGAYPQAFSSRNTALRPGPD